MSMHLKLEIVAEKVFSLMVVSSMEVGMVSTTAVGITAYLSKTQKFDSQDAGAFFRTATSYSKTQRSLTADHMESKIVQG